MKQLKKIISLFFVFSNYLVIVHAQTFDGVYNLNEPDYPIQRFRAENRLIKITIQKTEMQISGNDTIAFSETDESGSRFSLEYYFNSNGSILLKRTIWTRPDGTILINSFESYQYDELNRIQYITIAYNNSQWNRKLEYIYYDTTDLESECHVFTAAGNSVFHYYTYDGSLKKDSTISQTCWCKNDSTICETIPAFVSNFYDPDKQPAQQWDIYQHKKIGMNNTIKTQPVSSYFKGTDTYLFNNAGQLISINAKFKCRNKDDRKKYEQKHFYNSTILEYNEDGTIAEKIEKSTNGKIEKLKITTYTYTFAKD